MTEAPSPFSKHNPRLQTAWDATSLTAFAMCPRRYYYQIIMGWRKDSTDLQFGILFHVGREAFWRARLSGATRDEAQLLAVERLMKASVTYTEDGTPIFWNGEYAEMWRCIGTEKYKPGSQRKCPYSHKGRWTMGPSPSICGECGSETHIETRWLPYDNTKNRLTLVRTLAWYCEDQPEEMLDGLHPITLPDGNPAIELPFRLPLPWTNEHGETLLWCGYLDDISCMGNDHFVVDGKSTKMALSSSYFEGFQPNFQFDGYDLAGNMMFPDLSIKGVIADSAQVMVGGSRFGKHVFYHNDSQREELLSDIKHWTGEAEKCAEDGHWPMNRSSCRVCKEFRGICSKDAASRDKFLEADFKKEFWNPLEDR